MEAGIFSERTGVDAVGELLGERGYPRRTRGNPARTKALAVLYAYAVEYGLPELVGVAKHLCEAWSGEDGYDYEQTIRAIAAAAEVQIQKQEQNGTNGTG